MGQENSTGWNTWGQEAKELKIAAKVEKQKELELKNARNKIEAYRIRATLRAGTDDVCLTLLSTLRTEKERFVNNWTNLNIQTRRTLVAIVREKVVVRASILHGIISRRSNCKSNARVVRKLMEKCAFELFDTTVIYDDNCLPLFVEETLNEKGGGKHIPFGLLQELEQTFEKGEKRSLSIASYTSSIISEIQNTQTNSNEINQEIICKNNSSNEQNHINKTNESTLESSLLIKNSSSDNSTESQTAKSPSTPNLITSRSINSLQGYYNSSDQAKTDRQNVGGSRTVLNLLNFMPDSKLDLTQRKELTKELLLEIRNNFLVQFAVLMFSELFDDYDKLKRKYEYNSDSDTDVAFSDCTDSEEEEEEEEEGSFQ